MIQWEKTLMNDTSASSWYSIHNDNYDEESDNIEQATKSSEKDSTRYQ